MNPESVGEIGRGYYETKVSKVKRLFLSAVMSQIANDLRFYKRAFIGRTTFWSTSHD